MTSSVLISNIDKRNFDSGDLLATSWNQFSKSEIFKWENIGFNL